jgi:hypothetical protein
MLFMNFNNTSIHNTMVLTPRPSLMLANVMAHITSRLLFSCMSMTYELATAPAPLCLPDLAFA